MKLISKIWMLLIASLYSLSSIAQISNEKTETVKISGNCDMCKTTIENAGSQKKIAKVSWDKATKTATLTYDSKKTTREEILKRIALVGYDNEIFLAPDDVYSKLPECCRYDRNLKPVSKTKPAESDHNHHDEMKTEINKSEKTAQLELVFDRYFSLKDALISSDANESATNAASLLQSLKAVNIASLTTKEHDIWMRVNQDLISSSEQMSSAKDIAKQRAQFAQLSEKMHELMMASGYSIPVYYQYCPMYNNGKGAYWLSKENAIKNPYYGTQMLSCGKTVETIQSHK